MKKVLFAFFASLLIFYSELSYTQEILDYTAVDSVFTGKKEIYFKFNIASRDEINAITKVISIDNVTQNNEVYAYANKKMFAAFLTFHYDYTLLQHPGEANPKMYEHLSKEIQLWDAYPTYSAYEAQMNQYATAFPTLCKIYNILTLSSGRKLLLLKISSNVNTHENEPQFLYTSTIHGNETSGFIHMLHLIDTLLTSYGSNPRITALLNNTELWINPLANPDGTYGASGGSSISGAIRGNANGVDLNRNYLDILNGPHPDGNAWQPETQAFMGLADTMNFVMSANFHEGAEVCNYPWDSWTSAQNLHADDNWWQLVSNQFADSAQAYGPSGYFTDVSSTGITEGGDWYVITGGRQDYMNYFKHCREETIEISGTQSPSGSSLPAMWKGLKRSFFNYMEQSLKGIRGIITDSCTGQGIRAKVFITGHDVDSSHVYSALPLGNYHRPIYTGTYNLTFSAPGYQSKTFNNISVTNGNTVIQNVVLKPLAPIALFDANITSTCSDSISFTDHTGGVNIWFWDFGDGTTSTLQNPVHLYASGGTYTVQLTVNNCAGSNTMTKPGYITVTRPPDPVAGNVSNCGPASFTLNATGIGNLSWYDAASGGNLLGTGATYTTPVLTTTTTYYVQAENTPALQSAGKPDNSGGGGTLNNAAQYLIFDSYVPFTLLSVVVYPSTTGNRTFELRNSSGAVIQSLTVNITTILQQTVILNFNVPIGTGLQLGCQTGSTVNLYRNNNNVNYPYTTAGILSVTGSSAGSGYYYYFYNWQVQEEACSSAMVPVVAAINAASPLAGFIYSAIAGTVSFTNTSTDGVTYAWDFGDGGTSSSENPSHTYTANGSYLVELITYNGCGSDTTSDSITITTIGNNELSNQYSIEVFPNPFNVYFNLMITATNAERTRLVIVDVLGKVVKSEFININAGKNLLAIDAGDCSRGLYYLMIGTAEGNICGKVLIKE